MHQIGKQRELPRRQLKRGVAPPTPVGRDIDAKITDHQRRSCRQLRTRPPQQGPQPGQQNRVRERLRDVVIGPGIECLRLIPFAIFGRQHEHRHPTARGPELRHHREPVATRKHHIKDNSFVVDIERQREPHRTVMRDIDQVTLIRQAATQRPGHRLVVLHDQHTHINLLPIIAARMTFSGSSARPVQAH